MYEVREAEASGGAEESVVSVGVRTLSVHEVVVGGPGAGTELQARLELIIVPSKVVLLLRLVPASEEEPLLRSDVPPCSTPDTGWMTDGTNTQLKCYSLKIQGLALGNFAIKSFTAPP